MGVFKEIAADIYQVMFELNMLDEETGETHLDVDKTKLLEFGYKCRQLGIEYAYKCRCESS